MELNKVVIAPDSFKGALSSRQVANIIYEELMLRFPACVGIKMPIADGGEGSLETILAAAGGAVYQQTVLSPDDRMIEADLGILPEGVAVVELVQSSGLTKQNGLHPMSATTYGFGQLIAAALGRGARSFVLCIGGSATTDGGCGMAAALGMRFLNKEGESFVPSGATLKNIVSIDPGGLDARVLQSDFTVMCDVENPLFGPDGAAYSYAPQKGANEEETALLDAGLRHLNAVLSKQFQTDFSALPGGGAAGGLGAGCAAFLNARLQSGSEAILALCGFAKHAADADLIITGEGKLDEQSFQGKALSGILKAAGKVPVLSISGVRTCADALLFKYNVTAFEASEGASIAQSMAEPAKYLRAAAAKAILYYQKTKE